jgi:hypothetical protein
MEGIARLISTFGDETDPKRQVLRRAVILRLLTGETTRALNYVSALIARLDEV